MSNQIPCTIIRDIAPLYADDLVAEETRQVIEEHCEKCEDCKKQYAIVMKEIEHMEQKKENIQILEVDGMKKINTYQRSNMILGALISFLLGASIPVLKVGVPVLFGNGITEYQLARLQAMWQIGAIKMLISGVVVCGIYLGINTLLKKKKVVSAS